MIGKTILHYKILDKLGEGGMGVVYKAEDTKLERTVALKFLSLAAIGEEEKKRFKREAKAAASLNHPNIAHIYAIDEVDGQLFIAMEFIEGQSLAEMVATPLPLDKAIDYATQTAAGLQAAHEKGITHRDIKSANIMVTDKGQIKIMDFGLAKLANRSKLTQLGTTLGTAAYMSPEQSRGENTDNRADIWSLGVVLYEMISGQLPFKGDYEQAVMYSIQNEDPEPLTALRTGVPLALDGIIAKALAKEPDTRYQHVDELPADLKAIDTTTLNRSRISTPMLSSKIAGQGGRWLTRVATGVLFLAFLVLSFVHFRETAEEAQPVRFTIPIPESLTSVRDPSISPDGRKIAFIGTESSAVTSIWLRPLDALEAVPVPGTDDVSLINFWSPDSRFIVYLNSKGRVKKIPVAGGAAETILEIPKGSWDFLGSWGKDGTILYNLVPISDGIYQIPATGGTPARVTTVDTASGEVGHWWPQFLPDGRHFLYTVDTEDKPDIYVGSLDSKQRRRLLSGASFATYVAPGYLWYLRDRTFMVQPFDQDSHELLDEPVPVFDADLNYIGVSETKVMVYQTERSNRRLIWFDRRGNRLGEVGEEGRYFQIALSPDEKRLAVNMGSIRLPEWEADIQIVDLERGVFSRFTTGVDPVWSPDSRRLLFTSDFNLLVKNLQGGEAEMLLDPPELMFAEDWTQDGRYALCHVSKSGLQAVWAVPLSGDRAPIPVVQASLTIDEPHVSPDGRWLAYTADETGRFEIYVQPFLATGERIRISTDGGGQPRWRKDGKELFYLALDGTLMAVDIAGENNIKAGIPKPLFKVVVTVNPNLDQFVVTGDGQRFLVITEVDVAQAPFQVILNWPEALLSK